MNKNLLGTDVICQVGVIVRDVARAAQALAGVLGVDVPPINLTDAADVAHTRLRGQPTGARAKLCFFQLGSLSLEFIEPVGEASTWAEFLRQNGEGIHHIAFEVKGTDQVTASLAARGMPVLQQGDYAGGRYTYVESAASLGFILELLENY